MGPLPQALSDACEPGVVGEKADESRNREKIEPPACLRLATKGTVNRCPIFAFMLDGITEYLAYGIFVAKPVALYFLN